MEEKNQKSIEERQKELRNAILQLNIFTEIDNNSLNYQDSNIKKFLHALCPKHINEMDEVITCQSINKERLKKIIVDSIYDELNAFFQSSDAICTSKNCIDINRNEISTSVNCDKHSVSRRANDAYFGYVPEKDSYAFSDYDKQLYIKTCDDNNEEILIHYYGSKLKQKITDNNLKKSAKECLVFLKSVSLAELEMYYQTFTQNITQTKKEELPSHETIISAMQKAQKTVEKMRKKEENKEKEDKKEAKKENKEEKKKNDDKKEEKLPSLETIISAMQKAQKTVEKTRKEEEEKEEKKEEEDINNKPAGTNMDNAPRCFGSYKKDGKVVYRCFGCDIPCL